MNMNYNCVIAPNACYQRKNSTNFTGNKQNINVANDVRKSKSPLKKIMPWIFSGFALIGGANACSDGGNRYSGIDTYDGIKVEYCNVQQETKDSVMKPVYELKSQLTKENDFLDGIKIDIAKSFNRMNENEDFQKYVKEYESDPYILGTSFYSDSKLPKHIAIQEKAHKDFRTVDASTGKKTMVPTMRQTLMHEVGHHFDNYFGHDHNANYAQKWDSLLAAKANDKTTTPYNFITKTKEDKKLDVQYNWHNSLSDKQEFQEALLKDLNKIRTIPENSKQLPKNIKYYTGNFDLTKTITAKDVDIADGARGEVYANLFSYASGQNEGDKEKFIKCFENSYKIVKKDIAKYLKIVK